MKSAVQQNKTHPADRRDFITRGLKRNYSMELVPTCSSSKRQKISFPIQEENSQQMTKTFLETNCLFAESNQRQQTFNEIDENGVEILDNIVPSSRSTTGFFDTDSEDTTTESSFGTEVHTYLKGSRAIDREHIKLGQTTQFSLDRTGKCYDLPDLTFPSGVEKVIENIEIEVNLRSNDLKHMVHYGLLDDQTTVDLGNVQINVYETDLKAPNGSLCLPVITIQGKELQNHRNAMLEDRTGMSQTVETNRSKAINKSKLSVKVIVRYPNMVLSLMNKHAVLKATCSLVHVLRLRTTLESKDYKCMDYVGNYFEKKIDSSHRPVPEEKRKHCKQKINCSASCTRSQLRLAFWFFAFFNLLLPGLCAVPDFRGTNGSSIQIFPEGNNIRLECTIYCDNSDQCLGSVKWEGGPDSKLLTHDSCSSYPSKYEAVRRNQSFFDLRIINATMEDFNSTYKCWHRFYWFDAYLANLAVQPWNLTTHKNYDENTLIAVEMDEIYPVPKISAYLGMHDISSFVIIQPKKKGVFYNCSILLKNEQIFCSYPYHLVMSFHLPGISKVFFDDQVNHHICQNETNLIAVHLPWIVVVILVLVVIFIIYMCKKPSTTDQRIPTSEELENLDQSNSGSS